MYKHFIKWTCILITIIHFSGCKSENDSFNEDGIQRGIKSELKGALMKIAYDITTFQRYECDFEKLSELDLAHINPSEEKHHIEMFLLPDGTVNTIIEEMDFERSIKIPHQVLPNDIPGVKRTEIIGNTINMYDINGKRLGTQQVEMPRQQQLVAQIREMSAQFSDKELAQAFATMQGRILAQNFEKMIDDAEAKGQVIEHGEQYVTMRINSSEIDPRSKGSIVLLMDKSINKMAGFAVYDENENLNFCTYYGYDREGAPVLSAIRTEQLILLPSGA